MLPLIAFSVLLSHIGEVPARQPQLAANGDRVVLTYGAGSAVYVAVSEDRGATFPKAHRVGGEGKLSLGRHRGPRVVWMGDALLVSAHLDGELVSWRSSDGGKTWSAPAKVSDVPQATREGLHAMAAGKDFAIAVWLDLRTTGMKLYSATTRDGLKWSKNELVYQSPDGAICTCCHPSVLVDASGTIHVMWRNALGGNRDMYAAVSRDQGKAFQGAAKLGEGNWQLNACPMDGGGMVRSGSTSYTVWRREQTIYAAEAGKPERALGPGKDPAIALTAKGPAYAWTEGMAVKALLPGDAAPRTLAPHGGFVQLLSTPGGLLVAWETHGGIATELLRD